MAIDPTPIQLQQFVADDTGGPVVMLNLLRWKDGDKEPYLAYAAATAPFFAAVGGELLYAGDGSTALVADDGQAWDAVLIARYPSRAAFLEMVTNPEYLKVSKLRTAALREAVLQATTPWPR